jgi:hypothetical protein
MPKAFAVFRQTFAGAGFAFVTAAFAAVHPCHGAELFAGGYSFSDELGGFRLVSASGKGTPDDPVVLVEEIAEVAPVTLVIRNRDPATPMMRGVQSQLNLVKQVVNRSNRVWAAFEFELQEIKGKPSVYSDGLSFKQFAAIAPDVASDSFADNDRQFEPYDRIEFRNGHVDPEATATFRVTITDPTPTPEFYLVQDPKLLAAELPHIGPSFAALDEERHRRRE